MTYNIDRTFPKKLGDITSINGLPFDTEAATFNKRLTRLFKRIFNGMSKYNDETWKLLKDMISNSNEVFGLVGIDGYYTDIMGKNDLGLVFNMGIPKLRGRRINYLDRVYCRVSSRSDLKFYNSSLDDDIDDVHFDFNSNNKVPAWHPHISSGTPCLGSYINDLAKWKSEGNPIMYLKTVHQFVNTWNVRSPYWNLNQVIIDHVNGKKAFKSSKFINAFHRRGLTQTRQAERWVYENVNEINTGSIANDIYCLVDIYGTKTEIKKKVTDTFLEFCKPSVLHYLRGHRRSHHDNEPSRNDTIINAGTRILIPKKVTTNGIDTTVFNHRTINHGKLNDNNNYSSKRIILDGLSRVIYDIFKWMRTTEPINDIFKDDEYIMSMECKYHFPLISKNNAYFDEMTLSGLYDHRVFKHSNEDSSVNTEYYSKKRVLLDRIDKRKLRLYNLYMAYYRRKLNDESVSDTISKKIQKFFHYTIDRKNPFTKVNSSDSVQKGPVIYYHIFDQGRFWNNLGIYSTQGMFKEVDEFVKNTKCNENIETLINTFELLKRELVLEETNTLINQYDKVIRRLKDYGHKTSHSEKDSQQIHLSFK